MSERLFARLTENFIVELVVGTDIETVSEVLEDAIDITDVTPRPAIGWVKKDGKFVPPTTPEIVVDETPVVSDLPQPTDEKPEDTETTVWLWNPLEGANGAWVEVEKSVIEAAQLESENSND